MLNILTIKEQIGNNQGYNLIISIEPNQFLSLYEVTTSPRTIYCTFTRVREQVRYCLKETQQFRKKNALFHIVVSFKFHILRPKVFQIFTVPE